MENILTELRKKGICAKEQWITKIGIENEKIYDIFLESDIEDTSNDLFDKFDEESNIFNTFLFSLPYDVVFQINEVVDISIPYSRRAMFEQAENGSLKILIQQGALICCAIALSQINGISVCIELGTKLLIKKGTTSIFGVFLLNQENCEVLGGKSEKIIEKRKKLHKYQPNAILTLPVNSSTEIIQNEISSISGNSANDNKLKRGRKKNSASQKKMKKEKPKLQMTPSSQKFLDDSEGVEETFNFDELERIASQNQTQKPSNTPLSDVDKNISQSLNALKIVNIDKLCLVKKRNQLVFAIQCSLSNGTKARLHDEDVKRVINCSPAQCISMSKEEMQKISDNVASELIGKTGYLNNGMFKCDI